MNIPRVLLLLAIFGIPMCAGDISFTIIEYPKGKVPVEVCSGKKAQMPAQIIDRAPAESTQCSKYFELCGGFGFSVAVSQEAEIKGFGICAEGPKVHFSWEWFDKEKDQVFDKLQESGKIFVKTTRMTGFESIISIEFLTDISLRLHNFGKDDSLTHRITIKKGSIISLM